MKILVVLQARLGSTRLPRKVLAELAGQPLLVHVIRRARNIPGIADVLLATTDRPEDKELLSLAEREGIPAFAGSSADVLDRYYRAVRKFPADAIVRVTADCPLLDPEVSGRVVSRFKGSDVDYVSNAHPPTFPDGLDTEVFSYHALERAWSEARMPSEREHVTPYIWKKSDLFRVANVENEVDLSSHRWTVDEPEDLGFVRQVYQTLVPGHGDTFGMKEVLALLSVRPDLSALNASITRDEGYAKSLREDENCGDCDPKPAL